MADKASYILWLKARSLIALGITTATLKGPSAAGGGSSGSDGASVAAGSSGGASVEAAPPQALINKTISITRLNHIKFLFIFLLPYQVSISHFGIGELLFHDYQELFARHHLLVDQFWVFDVLK
jgi:hypothetical protein